MNTQQLIDESRVAFLRARSAAIAAQKLLEYHLGCAYGEAVVRAGYRDPLGPVAMVLDGARVVAKIGRVEVRDYNDCEGYVRLCRRKDNRRTFHSEDYPGYPLEAVIAAIRPWNDDLDHALDSKGRRA